MKTIIYNNSEKSRRMGINGRRLVVSEFSEKIVVSQTLKLYKKKYWHRCKKY
jgi:hypothetical protein